MNYVKYLKLLLVVFVVSCSNDDSDLPLPTSKPNMVSINSANSYQTIKGFGACNSVFRGATNFPKEADIQKAYGTSDSELGLSIFRVSIPENSENWQAVAQVAKYAFNRDATIFASPWNAPDHLLDDPHSEDPYPSILPSKYGEYVEHLNAFDTYFESNGVDLYAISIQNEPDIGEWTQWNTAELFDFTKHYAGNINTKVITAESFNFNRAYYTDILKDEQASSNIDIVGGHIYGNGLGQFELAENANKEIWMTEYLLNEYTDDITQNSWKNLTEEQKWKQSLEMLTSVHEAMESNWNAYIWWYMKRYYGFIGDGLQGEPNGEILKRGWAFSHFSKFIRPNSKRIQAKKDSDLDIKVTAYENDSQIVIVLINDQPTAITKTRFQVSSVNSAKAYQTSIDKNREPILITENSDNVELSFIPKQSVITIIIEK